MTNEHDHTEEVPEERLDAGMRAAFGDDPQGVQEALERRIGINLRDLPGEGTPIVRPSRIGGEETPPVSKRYQVVGELARGGVGVVYKGRDIAIGRDVAMKVLRADLADEATMVERFVDEAQITGQLQHPGIVPVYELGLQADERPYFAMKLVKGKTLAALLAEREDPTKGRRKFLGIFEQVCLTMGYAHARGVIHRDLKPANVMVGAFGEVQIVDWGFAKVLTQGGPKKQKKPPPLPDVTVIATTRLGSEGSASIAGSVMGTPAYMPPEQAMGMIDDLDERSDVFSLGAILCEILTGKPPYTEDDQGKNLLKAAQADLDDAFERLDGCGLRPPLIELTKKCLGKDQGKRPAEAMVVARAVVEHLAETEERARGAELKAVAAKARAEAEREKAAANRSLAAAERLKATQARKARWLTAGLAAAVLLVVAGGGWIYAGNVKAKQERLAKADRAVDEELENVARLRGEAHAADEVSAWSAALAAARKAEGLAQEAGADAQARVANQIAELEKEMEATRARSDRNKLEGDVVVRLEGIRARRGDQGDFLVADQEYADAFSSLGLDVTKGDPERIAEKIRNSRFAEALIEALDDWAWVRRNRRQKGWERLVNVARAADRDEWRNRLRDAVGSGKKDALRNLAALADLEQLSAASLHLLAVSLGHAGDPERAVEILEAARRKHPDDPWISLHLGTWLNKQGRHREAARCLRAALARRPGEPGIANNLGLALNGLGDLEGAIATFDEAVRLKPDFPAALNNRGMAHLDAGELDDALDSFEKALAKNPEYAYARYNLGKTRFHQGDPDGAIKAFRRALELDPHLEQAYTSLVDELVKKQEFDGAVAVARHATRENPRAAWAFHVLGFAYGTKGDLDEAAKALEKAVLLDPGRAGAHHDLGSAFAARLDWRTAAKHFDEAVRLDASVAQYHHSLGFALFSAGIDLERSTRAFRKAVEIAPNYAAAWDDLSKVYMRRLESEAARECCERVLSLNPDAMTAASSHNTIGDALALQDRMREAEAHFRKAVALNPSPVWSDPEQKLAGCLVAQGRLREALPIAEALHEKRVRLRGTRAGFVGPGSPFFSQMMLDDIRRALPVADRLDDLVAGRVEPKDWKDRAAFCWWAHIQKYNATSVREYVKLEAEFPDPKGPPRLVRDLVHNVASAAMFAGVGHGKDAADLKPAERAEMRAHARRLLRRLMANARALRDVDPNEARYERDTAASWRLLGPAKLLHDEDFLRWFPEEERADFRKLWRELDDFLEESKDWPAIE